MKTNRPVVSTAPEYRAPSVAPAPPPPVPLPRRRLPFGLLFVVLAAGGLTAAALWTEPGRASIGLVRDKVNQLFPSSTPPAPTNVISTEVVVFGLVDLENRVVGAHPEVPGRVAVVKVREGQTVKKGAELLRLDDEQARLAIKAAEVELDNATTRLEQAKKLPEQQQAEIDAQKSIIAGVESQKKVADAALETQERQKAAGIGKEDLYKQASALVDAAGKSVQAEKAKLKVLELKKEQLEFDIKRAAGEVEARRVAVDQAKDNLKKRVLLAPADGKILRLQVAEGDLVTTSPKDPAILFAPGERYIVRAEVQQEAADDIDTKADVFVEDDLRPGKRPKWAGKVKRVGDWFAPRRQVILEPRQINDVRTQEYIIELKEDNNLRIGQRVRVTFRKRQAAKDS